MPTANVCAQVAKAEPTFCGDLGCKSPTECMYDSMSACAGHLPSLHPSLAEHVQMECNLSNHSKELVDKLSNGL